MRVNPPGTEAFGGGISGSTLVFEQRGAGLGNLRFYDIPTKTTSAPPAGWNTKEDEYSPTISGRLILFGRETSGRDIIYLGDRSTGVLQRLGGRRIVTNQGSLAWPGQVNGNYAVWTQCRNREVACNVVRYDIATKAKTTIPNTFARGRFQWDPSVTSTGTVYFIHDSRVCGHRARLVRTPLHGPSTVVVHFKPGYDVLPPFFFGSTFADDSAGPPVIYYSRVNCSTANSDIYKVVD